MKPEPIVCPHCSCDDPSMLEITAEGKKATMYYCNNCSKSFWIVIHPARDLK